MRVPPAFHTQRKFRESWANEIAADLDLDKLGILTINRRDGIDWVFDGQHRRDALIKRGFEHYSIDCRVHENLSDEEMAEGFLILNNQLTVSTFDKFQISCTANHARETAIRRIVESNGCKISQSKDFNCVGAVSALGKVHDRGGDVVLGQTIRTLRKTYDGASAAFEGRLVESMGLVYGRFNGRTSEAHMIARLTDSKSGIPGLMRRAEDIRMRTGNSKTLCLAAAITEQYNKGTARAKQLPDWWHEDPPPKHPPSKVENP